MIDGQCETYRFWEPVDDVYGECRIRRPAVIGIDRNDGSGRRNIDHERDLTKWPITICDDWCGEYQPRDTDAGQ